MIAIRENANSVTFAVKLQPRARRNEVVGQLGDALKVNLTAPPVDGRANESCIEFFAELLGVPRSAITIVSGQTSRNKVLRVDGITAAYLREHLKTIS